MRQTGVHNQLALVRGQISVGVPVSVEPWRDGTRGTADISRQDAHGYHRLDQRNRGYDNRH